MEDFVPRPSAEVTSSISKTDRPAPPVDVADAGAAVAADDDPMSQPIAAPERRPTPPTQTIAMVAPDRPAAGAAALQAETSGRRQAEAINPRRFRDAKPINFGKASPKHLAVHGVDVSRWQGNIDWAKLGAQGANFVYIKATDGGDHLDPMFARNWRAAGAAGLKRGAYHFFYWCRTAGEQADWFIRNVPKVDGALPPVIDVEWNGESSCKRRPSPAKVREKMQVFMDKLERYYGQRPIIYTSPDFHRDNLKGAFMDYPFWVRSVAKHPSKSYPGRKWLLWQYSGSGLSHGVSGRIDLNVFNGSEEAWREWASGGAEG
jgi:lysozyme